ncbi:MAG: CDP-alcohol phosphatidyltransferase family protein [Planctomycetota bacterium]|nr:CDP-alcohol phosphatidyltransferase family protein [Planctomycetota bacterium]
MVSVYDIKPAFQNLLRPVVKMLARIGVTANQVTVAAMLLSIVTGIWILDEYHPLPFLSADNSESASSLCLLLAIPVVLLLRMVLNAIDGMLAREHDMKSSLGAVLNELGDVISDAALYLPLAYVAGFNAVLVVGMVIVGIIAEMTGVIAVQIGASRRYDGPMGKSDRALVVGLLCGIVGLGYDISNWLDTILGVLIGLGVLTIWNRSRKALQECQ